MTNKIYTRIIKLKNVFNFKNFFKANKPFSGTF